MKNKCIAFYLRLSMADGDLGKNNKDESNSIENQRALLEKYIEDSDELTGDIREYIDDGYTGTNFNRPGFQQMLNDAGEGKISIILVKDLSRLGRDYIGVGDYVEQIFPMLGVRFIAVNNSFDSDDCIGGFADLNFAVSNMINSLYSRDLSKKIRSSLETIWEQGRATAPRVPFGYLWDKNSEKKWKIDPVAAKYVRKIFDYALAGNNTTQIAVKLNSEHIPTPGLYKKMTGTIKSKTLDLSPDSEKLWEPTKVRIILKSYEYTGALVMGKHIRFKSDENISKHLLPKEDQIIAENAHDAIVSLEEFNQAQEVIRPGVSGSHKSTANLPLQKILRCGNCHRLMRFSIRNGEYVFHCDYARKFGSFSACQDAYYRESEINTRVMYAIRQVINIANMLDARMESESARASLSFEFPDPEKMRSELEELKAERMRQYEAYSDRIITRETYIKKKNEISKKIEKLEKDLQKSEELLKSDSDLQTGIKDITNAANEIPAGVGLTAEIAQRFVETVYIYDETHMEIIFKCEDTILAAFDKCTADTNGVLIYPTEEESSGE